MFHSGTALYKTPFQGFSPYPRKLIFWGPRLSRRVRSESDVRAALPEGALKKLWFKIFQSLILFAVFFAAFATMAFSLAGFFTLGLTYCFDGGAGWQNLEVRLLKAFSFKYLASVVNRRPGSSG